MENRPGLAVVLLNYPFSELECNEHNDDGQESERAEILHHRLQELTRFEDGR